MKQLLIVFLIFNIFSMKSSGQNTVFSKAENWKFYAIREKDGYLYSFDTLKCIKNITADKHKMNKYVLSAYKMNDPIVLWKELYVATYEIDKKPRKIFLSNYGGFFYDDFTKQYYEIPDDIRDEWHTFVGEIYGKLFFIK